jgi:hypothetical protein
VTTTVDARARPCPGSRTRFVPATAPEGRATNSDAAPGHDLLNTALPAAITLDLALKAILAERPAWHVRKSESRRRLVGSLFVRSHLGGEDKRVACHVDNNVCVVALRTDVRCTGLRVGRNARAS